MGLPGRKLVLGSNCGRARDWAATSGNQRPLGFGNTGTFCGPETVDPEMFLAFSAVWKGQE